jgi:hypothetical protein
MDIVYIFAVVIVAFIILWFARWALSQFPQGEPVDRMAQFLLVALAVTVLVWAILAAFGVTSVPHFGRL